MKINKKNHLEYKCQQDYGCKKIIILSFSHNPKYFSIEDYKENGRCPNPECQTSAINAEITIKDGDGITCKDCHKFDPTYYGYRETVTWKEIAKYEELKGGDKQN